MEEPNSLIHPHKAPPQKNKQNTSTPFSNFIYKAIFACVLIALLPIFPSQSPELGDKNFVTCSWELLHLLLVGIAISYGLFSRRNSEPDTERETQLKPDNPQSLVSGILHVSSVFDDEETIESPRGSEFPDETKVQTWNYSQYNPGEPVVMVAAKESSIGKNNGTTKPLFLPVRSLKSTEGDGGKEGIVLPSPIPWRSRSGRMEVKEESSPPPCSPPYSPPTSAFDAELGPSRIPSFRYPTPRSTSRTPSPRRLSPSPSMSSEIRGKTSEDMGRKKSFYKSSPPPAPPPPPLPLRHGYHYHFVTEKKNRRKSFKDELEDRSTRGLGLESIKPDNGSHAGGRSVRTARSLSRKQSKKKNEFREKMIIESDGSDSDDEDYGDGRRSYVEEEVSKSAPQEAGPEENEVDKKADEFIAKFREQIRLQRIASIKRSTEQRSVRNSN